jgi:hypothetical protein
MSGTPLSKWLPFIRRFTFTRAISLDPNSTNISDGTVCWWAKLLECKAVD